MLQEEVKELKEALKEKEDREQQLTAALKDREQQLTAALKEKEEELKKLRQVHFIPLTFRTQAYKRLHGSYMLGNIQVGLLSLFDNACAV